MDYRISKQSLVKSTIRGKFLSPLPSKFLKSSTMGYNRGMRVELCKFTGGTCNLCRNGNVCKRDPQVDMGVVRRFQEYKDDMPPHPTCSEFEPNWRKAFNAVVNVVSGSENIWNGLSKEGNIVVRVHTGTILNPSRWFKGGCKPVSTTLFEKLPKDNHSFLDVGIRNGIVECYGTLFAIDTRWSTPEVMRPVQLSYRQELLNRIMDFEAKLGPIYN